MSFTSPCRAYIQYVLSCCDVRRQIGRCLWLMPRLKLQAFRPSGPLLWRHRVIRMLRGARRAKLTLAAVKLVYPFGAVVVGFSAK